MPLTLGLLALGCSGDAGARADHDDPVLEASRQGSTTSATTTSLVPAPAVHSGAVLHVRVSMRGAVALEGNYDVAVPARTCGDVAAFAFFAMTLPVLYEATGRYTPPQCVRLSSRNSLTKDDRLVSRGVY